MYRCGRCTLIPIEFKLERDSIIGCIIISCPSDGRHLNFLNVGSPVHFWILLTYWVFPLFSPGNIFYYYCHRPGTRTAWKKTQNFKWNVRTYARTVCCVCVWPNICWELFCRLVSRERGEVRFEIAICFSGFFRGLLIFTETPKTE